MSGDEPIELPALSAERHGPTAAVCANGHVLSWFVDAVLVPKYCAKCGGLVFVACPACHAPLPADGEMLQWVPYHVNCPDCGTAYPWQADEIARAKRALAEQAETENWGDTVIARAAALVDDIAADRAAPSGVDAALQWLAKHGAQSATATILDTVERIGSGALRQALRASYPGRL